MTRFSIGKNSRIYISGHTGLLGTALVEFLHGKGYSRLITAEHKALELTDQAQVKDFFQHEKPEYVFHVAAKTGGVLANKEHPLDYLEQGCQIALNVLSAAHTANVKGLVYVASAQVYPDDAEQPIVEDAFMGGRLPDTLAGYALAKMLGVKFCECAARQDGSRFISAVLTGMYGLHDKGSTVMPMLLDRFAEACIKGLPEIAIWGTGNARREFVNAKDAAEALVFLMENGTAGSHYNIGCGEDFSIRELAQLIKEISGFKGNIVFDTSKPEGAMRRLLDSSRIKAMGWSPKITFRIGVEEAYKERFEARLYADEK